MSSGETLFAFKALDASPPAANAAGMFLVSDLSTPGTQFWTCAFDGAADEHMDFHATIPGNYSGTTGWTFLYKYTMSATSTAVIELEFRVLDLNDLDDLDTDLGIDLQTPASLQDTPIGTVGALMVTPTGVALAKANFGSAVAGQDVIIRVTRDVSVATNVDDLLLKSFIIKET